MRTPQTLLITSCKGGTGKTTVAANLASALTKIGRNILLIDCDFENRCLDLLLGCESDILYDICDVALGRVDPARAILKHKISERTINFVAAPAIYDSDNEIMPQQLKKAIQSLAMECKPDLILLDTSGTVSSVELCSPSATGALIVTSHQPTAIRAAEKTGIKLNELGITETRLIINSFDFQGSISGDRYGIGQIIDMSHIRIIGVVPYAYELEIAQESSVLATELPSSNCSAAFKNIAGRLTGETISLFTDFKHIPIKKMKQK